LLPVLTVAGFPRLRLCWAGTFHGIGARLLREYAEQIGLDPAFTIHDREDSADLMNLVRHDRGFSKTESRFPAKGTCLSIYSRCARTKARAASTSIKLLNKEFDRFWIDVAGPFRFDLV
jgi:superfamily I DNA/RNA helicase